MINTNYTALGNYFDSKNIASEVTGKTSVKSGATNTAESKTVGNANDVAVILTLSNQKNYTSVNSSNAMIYTRTSASSSVLKVGSTGTKVKTLQKNLTKLGYSTNGTDGIFGNDTKKAVIAFQKAYGLTADGIVGSATQKAIKKVLETNSTSPSEGTGNTPSNNSATVQRMLDNLKNDTSLGLSKDKKTAMITAA